MIFQRILANIIKIDVNFTNNLFLSSKLFVKRDSKIFIIDCYSFTMSFLHAPIEFVLSFFHKPRSKAPSFFATIYFYEHKWYLIKDGIFVLA